MLFKGRYLWVTQNLLGYVFFLFTLHTCPAGSSCFALGELISTYQMKILENQNAKTATKAVGIAYCIISHSIYTYIYKCISCTQNFVHQDHLYFCKIVYTNTMNFYFHFFTCIWHMVRLLDSSLQNWNKLISVSITICC